MKIILLLIPLLVFSNLAKSQVHYKSNESKTEMFYENVIDFKGKTKKELYELIKKHLIINDFPIRYEDDNDTYSDIYSTGKLETKYRGHAGFFFSTTDFNCVYDLQISVKEEKIKYKATNFILLYKSVRVNSYGWFSSPSAWSTTSIPTEIPKKPVNEHFKAGKTHKKYLLFQDLDNKMTIFEQGLIDAVYFKKSNW